MKTTAMERSVDVVIVNWNTGSLLGECLASIASHTSERSLVRDVVVVDNASDDGSAETPSPDGLSVRWIRNADNRGFGRACNQGAATGDAPFLLFLNPDTRLEPGSLSVPVGYLLEPENHAVAIAGVQTVHEDGSVSRTCARAPGWGSMLLQSLGLDRAPGLRSKGYMMREWPHHETRQVDHVIGAFYLVRRDVFDALGGFDEDYFVYLEDLDLSMRVKARGLRCVFLATARVYHAEGGSSKNIKARRLFYSLHSRMLFAEKHLSLPGRVPVLISTLLLEPLIRILRAVMTLSFADAVSTLKGYQMLYGRLLTRSS